MQETPKNGKKVPACSDCKHRAFRGGRYPPPGGPYCSKFGSFDIIRGEMMRSCEKARGSIYLCGYEGRGFEPLKRNWFKRMIGWPE